MVYMHIDMTKIKDIAGLINDLDEELEELRKTYADFELLNCDYPIDDYGYDCEMAMVDEYIIETENLLENAWNEYNFRYVA